MKIYPQKVYNEPGIFAFEWILFQGNSQKRLNIIKTFKLKLLTYYLNINEKY